MGMFGNTFKAGGAGRDIAGYIGDALLMASGGRAAYAPAKQQFRTQQAEAEEMARKAAQPQYHYGQNGQVDMIDPTTGQVKTVRAATPQPVNNDTVNDYDFILKTLGPDAAKQYLGNVAAGPPQIVTTPQGTFAVPRGAIGGAAPQAAPQMPAIGSVIADPRKQGGARPMGAATFPGL